MTDQKGKFSSLEICQEDYRTILSSLPRLVMLIDMDGTIRYWNDGGALVFGFYAEEMVGKAVWTLYPKRNKEIFNEERKEIQNKGVISEVLEGKHKDGHTIWVDVKRRFIKIKSGRKLILGTASDITPQIKAEEEVKFHKNRLEAILDTAVEGIVTIDNNGIIQAVNRRTINLFGYEYNELIGENVSILMPPPYKDKHDSYIQKYIDTGEKKIIGIGREVRGLRKDGSIFPMDLAVSEVRYNDEVIFMGLIRDITKRRRMENEILQISEEERMRIGQDLHDGLGQMLTGIGLLSNNLANRLDANALPGAKEAREIYSLIREADEQAKDLSHGLASIELVEDEFQTALLQLCKRAKRLFTINCTADLDPTIRINDKMSKLHMYRIVQEAMSNAVKHGHAKHIYVCLEQQDDDIRLIIRDNGRGFEEAGKEYSSKGMGIPTMKYRANILGGNLDIRRTEEGETRVICTIPNIALNKYAYK